MPIPSAGRAEFFALLEDFQRFPQFVLVGIIGPGLSGDPQPVQALRHAFLQVGRRQAVRAKEHEFARDVGRRAAGHRLVADQGDALRGEVRAAEGQQPVPEVWRHPGVKPVDDDVIEDAGPGGKIEHVHRLQPQVAHAEGRRLSASHRERLRCQVDPEKFALGQHVGHAQEVDPVAAADLQQAAARGRRGLHPEKRAQRGEPIGMREVERMPDVGQFVVRIGVSGRSHGDPPSQGTAKYSPGEAVQSAKSGAGGMPVAGAVPSTTFRSGLRRRRSPAILASPHDLQDFRPPFLRRRGVLPVGWLPVAVPSRAFQRHGTTRSSSAARPEDPVPMVVLAGISGEITGVSTDEFTIEHGGRLLHYRFPSAYMIPSHCGAVWLPARCPHDRSRVLLPTRPGQPHLHPERREPLEVIHHLDQPAGFPLVPS